MCHGQKSGGANTKYLVFWIGGSCARFLNFKNKTNIKKLIFKNQVNYLKFYVSIILFNDFSEIKQIYCNKLRYFVFWKIQEIVV